MKPAILLFCCCFFAFGQGASPTSETKTQTSANSSDQKPKDNDYGLGTGAHGRQVGGLDILSNTQGVDFGPYLQGVLQDVKVNWYHLIPESASLKNGKLAIEFAITKDGKLRDMRFGCHFRGCGSGPSGLESYHRLDLFQRCPGSLQGRTLPCASASTTTRTTMTWTVQRIRLHSSPCTQMRQLRPPPNQL